MQVARFAINGVSLVTVTTFRVISRSTLITNIL
jgi:hypothetical protein